MHVKGLKYKPRLVIIGWKDNSVCILCKSVQKKTR